MGELFYDLSCRVSNSSHFDDTLTTAFSQFGDRFKLSSHGLDHWRLSHNSEPRFFKSLKTIQHYSELVKESNSQENVNLEAKIDLRQASADLQTVWIFAVAS